MMTYEDFRREVLGLNRTRKHKVSKSYGVYDAYKYYRKFKPKDKKYILKESQYFSIIRTINDLFVEELLKGNDVTFPLRMGKLELRKRATSVDIVNGKVVNNMPVDWDRTLRLWAEDEEAYRDRFLVKIEEKEVFYINYSKGLATYNNRTYYQFIANRQLKRNLKKKIKQNEIDAFQLWQNNNKV